MKFKLVPIPNRTPIHIPNTLRDEPGKIGNIFNLPLTTTLLAGRRGSGKSVVVNTIIHDLVDAYPLVKKTIAQQGGKELVLRFGMKGGEEEGKQIGRAHV